MDRNGLRTVWHSGGSGGYNTVFLRFPEQHFAIACLCSNGKVHWGYQTFAYAVADAYRVPRDEGA